MLKKIVVICAVAGATVLAGCGGGGSDDAAVPPDTVFRVGGWVAGLSGTLVLRDTRSGEQAAVVRDGQYAVGNLRAGTEYDVVVQTPPVGQTCTVRNGRGTVSASVNNVEVVCRTDMYAVGGRIEGLAGRLVLGTADGRTLSLAADGPFAFEYAHGQAYEVQLREVPAGQICVLTNPTGTALGTVDNMVLSCSVWQVRLSGEASGITGPVTLRNGSTDTVVVTANGRFTFAALLNHGSTYDVTVAAAPAGQSCTVTGGRGTISMVGTALTLTCTRLQVEAPPPPIPATPTGLTLTYAAKSLQFAWSATADATRYQLYEDPDGAGPQALAALGSTVVTTSTSYAIPVLLHRKLNARYAVQACNVSGCGSVSATVTPDLSRAIGYFKASNPGANHRFGDVGGVALSADGSTLAVGAYGEASNGSSPADTSAADAGAVYIFTRTATGWAQQAYLKAPVPEASDFFGKTLALSADGNTLAIGMDGEDGNYTGTFAVTPAHNNGSGDSGAVFVYTRSGSAWAQQAYIKAANADAGDLFGFSVALSSDGNTLAVGAYLEDGNATTINGDASNNSAGDAGAVYVFTRSGTVWTQQAYVKAQNAEAGDWFGLALALSADGNTLAASAFSEAGNGSSPADNSVTGAGAVYVFVRTGSTWTQQAYLKSSNPEASDAMGSSLALSSDGNTLVAGAQGDDSNHTGTYAVTPADNNLANNAGAAYVFTRTGAAWSQQAYLKPANTGATQRFGNRTVIAGDGDTIVVGAYRESSASSGLAGNPADASALDTGAAYVFTRSGTTWTQQAYLKAPNAQINDRFALGLALARDGNTLAIAAPAEDSNATGIGGNQVDNSSSNAGAVYLY